MENKTAADIISMINCKILNQSKNRKKLHDKGDLRGEAMGRAIEITLETLVNEIKKEYNIPFQA